VTRDRMTCDRGGSVSVSRHADESLAMCILLLQTIYQHVMMW